MIYCILDGDMVYPSLASNIKITMENPDLKDKGSYTLDVTFPLSIYENQVKFRHLNRIDVTVSKNKFDKATLCIDGVEVISGTAVLTSVSEKEVKLQILNANSEFKYASGFDKFYIDELAKDWYFMFTLPGNPPTIQFGLLGINLEKIVDYTLATNSHTYVGDLSVGIYTPVYDETNDRIVNEIVSYDNDRYPLMMINVEVQLNLMYLMRESLKHLGYTADLSEIDSFPWNNIYIVNTGRRLPHWTLEKFITEFKALFGLSVRVNGNRVIFKKIDYDSEPVTYECVDEFTNEYDEEGLQNNSTGNLKYNLFDSTEKTFYTEIPEDVMSAFEIREFDSEIDMFTQFNSMSDYEKTKYIYSTPTGYFYARTESEYYTVGPYSLVRIGQFNKLVRDEENDDSQEINIVPVNMAKMDLKFRRVYFEEFMYTYTGRILTAEEAEISVIIPTTESEEFEVNDSNTVQEAIENGEISDSNSRQESERMEVFFLGSGTKSFSLLGRDVTYSSVGTDPTIDPDFKDKISFAFDKTQEGVTHIGMFHKGNMRIDGKNQKCYKFICDEIPDPTRIYVFHNKKYVCEKIELQVTDKGIDRVKTGYFYEVIS